MDGRIDVTTLLFLVLAVVIFLKLRSVLGRRTGHERSRFERYKAQQEASQRNGKLAGKDKVVTLPRREREEIEAAQRGGSADPADGEQRVKELAAGNPTSPRDSRHRSCRRHLRSRYLPQGRQGAYEIIVTAFAEGNRKTLKGFLGREVYEGFSRAIAERETRGEQIDQSFVGIKTADLVEAEVKGGIAQLTIKFVSELISATRDRAARSSPAIPSASRKSPISGLSRARPSRAIRTGSWSPPKPPISRGRGRR